ncbi:hypothetical protein BKA62DRAFT_785642 [Auriculariales sp. MPI-PUGE-AT-0066]|nr:hypothetical protein BKA62DRAFT_785642 [Auriculariales sp. MPI-PUGE-AT-0066]
MMYFPPILLCTNTMFARTRSTKPSRAVDISSTPYTQLENVPVKIFKSNERGFHKEHEQDGKRQGSLTGVSPDPMGSVKTAATSRAQASGSLRWSHNRSQRTRQDSKISKIRRVTPLPSAVPYTVHSLSAHRPRHTHRRPPASPSADHRPTPSPSLAQHTRTSPSPLHVGMASVSSIAVPSRTDAQRRSATLSLPSAWFNICATLRSARLDGMASGLDTIASATDLLALDATREHRLRHG